MLLISKYFMSLFALLVFREQDYLVILLILHIFMILS